MLTNDTPADAGTGGSDTSLTLDQAADRFLQGQRDRETDTAKTGADGNGQDQGSPEDDAKDTTAPEDDWLSDESDTAKPEDKSAETPETGQFAGHTSKVRMTDGTIVSVGDLIKGHMLQSDYSRKTETASQRLKDAEARFTALDNLEQALAAQREMVVHFLGSAQPQPPDAALASSDPLKWIEANAQFQAQQAAWNQWVDGFRTTAKQQQTAMAEQEKGKINELERSEMEKLQAKLPVFRDSSKAKSASEAIKKQLIDYYGYAPEEVGRVVDHRFAHMAHDAVRYRLGLTRSKKAIEDGRQAAPVQRPGLRAAPGSVDRSRLQQLTSQARKSGNLDDVVELVMAANRK